MKKDLKKYVLVFILILAVFFVIGCGGSSGGCGCNGCGASTYTIKDTEDIVYFPVAKGEFMKSGNIWDWLVYPMAWLMNLIAKNIVGFNYALTILIATVLIRSLAWPIYGKSNDMSLKMKILAPEQAKIEAKYKDKVDKESQQRKSMEMMQLYKKYKISFSSCLMPFLQMPIFLAFYETLRRIPYTTSDFIGKIFVGKDGVEHVVTEIMYNFGQLNTKLFGLDLFATAGSEWNGQRWGVYIIAALVAITQLGTQIMSQRRMNKQKLKMESDVPAYRRPASTGQQKQSETIMKVMLYTMPIIMVVFIIQSPAALGWYWLVGNIYTGIQTFISAKGSEKRLMKLKEKYDKEKFVGMRK